MGKEGSSLRVFSLKYFIFKGERGKRGRNGFAGPAGPSGSPGKEVTFHKSPLCLLSDTGLSGERG